MLGGEAGGIKRESIRIVVLLDTEVICPQFG
jgi:hypothetical protein